MSTIKEQQDLLASGDAAAIAAARASGFLAPSAEWDPDPVWDYATASDSQKLAEALAWRGKGWETDVENGVKRMTDAEHEDYIRSMGGGGGEATSFNFGTSSYKNPYAEQLDALTGKYLNRGPFTYDYTTDPLYQQYQKEYTRLGQRAMDDTIAKVSARTGGLASSYAGSAASQAYNNYMAALSNKIPELEQYAYGKYNDEGNTMLNQINLLRGLDSDAYGRYSSERAYGDSRADLAYDRNLAAQNQAFNRNLAGAQLLAQYGDMSGLEGVYGINGLQDKYNEANAVYAYGDDGTPYMISSAKGLNYLNTLPEGGSATGGDGSTWTRKNGQVVITDANGRTYRYGEAKPTYGGYLPQPQDEYVQNTNSMTGLELAQGITNYMQAVAGNGVSDPTAAAKQYAYNFVQQGRIDPETAAEIVAVVLGSGR